MSDVGADRGVRLREARKALRLSVEDVATRAGRSASGIRAIENGQNDLRPEVAEALAPIVKTTAAWLLTGEGEQFRQMVPVVGYVGAGSVATLFEHGQGGLDEVEPPAGSTRATVAAEVRGVSLGPAFQNALIFYDDVHSPVTEDQHGRLCVVGLTDGRVLVKILRPGQGNRFHLLSNAAEEPLLDQEVAWAARVKDIRPR